MDKRIISRILMPLFVIAVLVLWLLREIPATADMFAWYSLSWGVTIFLGLAGVKYLLDAIFMRSKGVFARKFTFLISAMFFVLGLICLTSAITIPQNLIAPIVALILAGAILLGVLFTGARKWDAGDNQAVGYKNYHQRKAEQERQEKKEKSKQN